MMGVWRAGKRECKLQVKNCIFAGVRWEGGKGGAEDDMRDVRTDTLC